MNSIHHLDKQRYAETVRNTESNWWGTLQFAIRWGVLTSNKMLKLNSSVSGEYCNLPSGILSGICLKIVCKASNSFRNTRPNKMNPKPSESLEIRQAQSRKELSELHIKHKRWGIKI